MTFGSPLLAIHLLRGALGGAGIVATAHWSSVGRRCTVETMPVECSGSAGFDSINVCLADECTADQDCPSGFARSLATVPLASALLPRAP
jgi:hypothetical protein